MEFFDYDPLSGATEYFEMDQLTGKVSITTQQDVEPLLDLNRALRNEGIKDTPLRDDQLDFRHYASVPQVVILEMLNKGINFFDKNDGYKVFKEINTNYPYLKVTNKMHSERK